jgi:hypothetical protein
MSDQIYLIDQHGELLAMPQRNYDSEDLLQGLLEKHPDLLAGDQMNYAAPRRWLLVDRECGVPGEEDGYDRWSLDHLFLDQDGIPTLVEVKRSTDTRIRREVVGQLLDYAANAVLYWPIDRIRLAFETASVQRGEEPDRQVLQLLDAFKEGDDAIQKFWDSVEANLRSGRVRLVFVADKIPTELQRIVEFLNEQMNPAEVLALEIKQFAGASVRTLVPRVIGLTAKAIQVKGSRGAGAKWTEDKFLSELGKHHGDTAVEVATEILQWARAQGLVIDGGRGNRHGSLFPSLVHENTWHTFASLWTHSGTVEMQFQFMKGPYRREEERLELLNEINKIRGVNLNTNRISARPSFHISVLAEPMARHQFLEIWSQYLKAVAHT